MSDQKNNVVQRDDKYWIKPGVEVAHREKPDRKMIVDDILKRTEKIKDGDEVKQKTFVIGIECHWFDEQQRYDRGRFLTMELIPFGEDPSEEKKDPESFPEEVPSSEVSA